MDYDHQISALIAAIKLDKSVIQPWRNKVIARLDEAQAFLMMGKWMTNLQPPPDLNASGELNPNQLSLVCTCPHPGVIDRACPVHGATV